jgi:hypothetical protein
MNSSDNVILIRPELFEWNQGKVLVVPKTKLNLKKTRCNLIVSSSNADNLIRPAS